MNLLRVATLHPKTSEQTGRRYLVGRLGPLNIVVMKGENCRGQPARALLTGKPEQKHDSEEHPGLFNAHWTPLYERLTVGSMAAIQRARAMFSAPLARAMLST